MAAEMDGCMYEGVFIDQIILQDSFRHTSFAALQPERGTISVQMRVCCICTIW